MRASFHLVGRVRWAHRNARPCVSFLFVFFASVISSLHAQVGNQNPGGASGIFNGQITTGCSYDPYTGNATRSITDIAVAGAVGEYPLALVRTANSRAPSTTEVFGWAGGWNHNYNWILEDSPTGTQNFHPTRYTVDFPDGRVETFRAVTWDTSQPCTASVPCFRVRPGQDTPQTTSSGVRERFVPLNTSTMLAYLVLFDGGKVEFTASQHVANNHYYYKYHATAIIDPYGLRTQLVDEVVANGTRRRLVSVIEPAGRYLHFFYVTTNGARIDHVTASDGRTVNYYYTYCNGCRLDHVIYYNNANWTARYNYCNSNVGQGLPPLLWTADDPMYPGGMKRIAYEYRTGNNADGSTPVYGQIFRERYWDTVSGHEASGSILSQLSVGTNGVTNNPNYRLETRADGATRSFIYSSAGYVTWASDFMGHQSTFAYDTYKYRNAYTDFNRHETDYTNDPVTGNVTQISLPLTPNDTPGQGNTHPTVNYTYTNNYYLHTIQGENGQTIRIDRDGINRVTQITDPAGGYETFSSYNAFNQPQTHRMVTGGTETFTYDNRGLKRTYRNPDNATGNPTARYQYDTYDRVSDITDVLGTTLGDANHTTSFSYTLRGQLAVTTLPNDNGTRHTVTNWYNPDGTMSASQNELYQTTNYTYDDYRRLRSVTPPVRGFGDNSAHATYFYYDANGTGDDYRYADSNVTWMVLPSGKKTQTIYDDNRRKMTVTAAPGPGEQATASYGYDSAGNLTGVTMPSGHWTSTTYDERNRPSSVSDRGRVTNFTYDTAARRTTINRPNGQAITYDTFDTMNRVTQQTATQSPGPAAVTKYVYYTPADGQNAPVGLLKTMQDPRLVAINSTYKYTYAYDSMGRKTTVTYPPPSSGSGTTEVFSYDSSGRLRTFKNRNNRTQTFSYDGLNRMTGFTWDDGGLTPNVSFGYDAASRLISINNANANISRVYYYDNLPRSETEQILSGGSSKTLSYTYDADGNRSTTTYPLPESYAFGYTYNGRNQLKTVNNYATYNYDQNGYIGNLTSRILNNSTSTVYTYDGLDRVTWVSHTLNGAGPWFNYGYYDNTNNRKYVRRWNGVNDNGDVFRYDYADQTIGVQLDVPSPQNVQSISQTISYDANGNRADFHPYGTTETYAINNLSQYSSRTINNVTRNATYDPTGNLISSPDPTASQIACTYDAQNRVLSASKGNTTMYFRYDGLNRQVSRRIGINGTLTFNVWDGWDLIEEYRSANGGATTAAYVYGATGLIAGVTNGQFNYYFQDGSGNTSHLTNASGQLVERYRYDLQGRPIIYDANNNQLSASAFGVRHLFTGQQWYSEVGLYDLRNRFYSPDIGRFLQPDPIGFRGGNNLYRYCRNNPVMRRDPFGLQSVPTPIDGDRVIVTADPLPPYIPPDPSNISRTGFLPGEGWLGIPWNPGAELARGKEGLELRLPDPQPASPSVDHPAPSSVPPQNPTQQVTAAALTTPPASLGQDVGVFSVWQQMLITAFNDPIGDHDNRLGPGDIATADLRYRPSDFDNRNNLINAYTGRPVRAYARGSRVTIYRQNGATYTGTITDTGAGFAAHRPEMGLPDGVPGTLWLDIWTRSGSEDPEWDLVLIQTGQ